MDLKIWMDVHNGNAGRQLTKLSQREEMAIWALQALRKEDKLKRRKRDQDQKEDKKPSKQ